MKHKLSDEEVRQIRAEYRVVKGYAINVIELAKRYSVSQLTIRDVAKGNKYEDVP